MNDISIARWETRGNDYLELFRSVLGNGTVCYHYRGNGCGGGFNLNQMTDEQAIERMSAPWGPNVGPVTVLKADRPSLKRVR